MDQDIDHPQLSAVDYCQIGYTLVSMLTASRVLGHRDLRSTIAGNYFSGADSESSRLVEAAVTGNAERVDAFLEKYGLERDRLDRLGKSLGLGG